MITISRKHPFQGFTMTFANGWTISVQTGLYNYHDKRGFPFIEKPRLAKATPNAEIAVWHRDEPMVKWPTGDTVLGWVSPDTIAKVMTYISNLPDDPNAWNPGAEEIHHITRN
jgi:hypothetical protein